MKLDNKDLLFRLSEFYKIFCDSTRLRILDVLMDNSLCVNEISELLNISQSAISHQLRYLRNSNLVKSIKNGKNVYYSISDHHIKTIIKYGVEHILEVI